MRLSLSKFLQLKFNVCIYQNLGMGLACLYIILLGKLYFFFNRNEKYKIEDAVETVFAVSKNRSEINFIKRNVLQGVCYHYYEKFFNAYENVEALKNFFEASIEAPFLRKLDSALKNGRGVLFVTGHYGGIEYIPIFLALKKYPISVIAKFKTKELKHALYLKTKDLGLEIIDAGEKNGTLQSIIKDLGRNRIVFIECDEIEEWKPSQKEKMFFLQKIIGVDRTINLIHRKTGSEVIFGILHRFNLRKYSLVIENCQDLLSRYNKSSSAGETVLKYLEQFIYSFPEEWYQWKHYADIEAFPAVGIELKKQTFTPLFKPALSEVL
jgi:Kdo2-lipid IVA lauroyltransferase/acyltransferase